MKLQAFLALVTYPDASADAVAAHAVAIARWELAWLSMAASR